MLLFLSELNHGFISLFIFHIFVVTAWETRLQSFLQTDSVFHCIYVWPLSPRGIKRYISHFKQAEHLRPVAKGNSPFATSCLLQSMKNDDDPLRQLQIRHFPCQKLSTQLFSVTNRLNSPHDSLLEWCDKIVLYPFKILWDTSSWHDNCTESSGACSSLKLIEIGSWLEGYWFKPMTPPTPWRNEHVVFSLFPPPNVKSPLSKAINHFVLKWNDSVVDIKMSLCMAAHRCECTLLHDCQLGLVWKRLYMFCKTFTPKSKLFIWRCT